MVEPKYDFAQGFHNGKAELKENNTIIEIDYQGNHLQTHEITSDEWATLDEFFENFSDDELFITYGYVDESGNNVVRPKFQGVTDFRDGFAYVKIDDKEGVINTAGAYVIEPRHVDISQVPEGYGDWSDDLNGLFEDEYKYEYHESRAVVRTHRLKLK